MPPKRSKHTGHFCFDDLPYARVEFYQKAMEAKTLESQAYYYNRVFFTPQYAKNNVDRDCLEYVTCGIEVSDEYDLDLFGGRSDTTELELIIDDLCQSLTESEFKVLAYFCLKCSMSLNLSNPILKFHIAQLIQSAPLTAKTLYEYCGTQYTYRMALDSLRIKFLDLRELM